MIILALILIWIVCTVVSLIITLAKRRHMERTIKRVLGPIDDEKEGKDDNK